MKNSQALKKSLIDHRFNFQSFGVKIGVKAERPLYLKEVKRQLEKNFPGGLEPAETSEVEYLFEIKKRRNRGFTLIRNESEIIKNVNERRGFFDMVGGMIRITIAEFARSKVFLHAGVVSWKGKAIVIPAVSYGGKTTLVAELIKKGASYYSDEYAVLDTEGNVHPFPKWLSIRGIVNDYAQIDFPPESFGSIGSETIPVGMVLIAKYKKKKKVPKKWRPKQLSPGAGVLEILPHAIPIRNEPKFVLEVLNKVATRAIIVKTTRGDAKEFSNMLLNYFEHQLG